MIDQRPDFELGTYRHYKGGEYEAYDLTCDEATGVWRVSYKPLYDVPEGVPTRWSRTIDVFLEELSVNGKVQRRFEKVTE